MTFSLGVAVFALVAVLVIGGEIVCRASRGRYATLPEIGRWLRGHAVLRFVLFVSWAFSGWHFFVR